MKMQAAYRGNAARKEVKEVKEQQGLKKASGDAPKQVDIERKDQLAITKVQPAESALRPRWLRHGMVGSYWLLNSHGYLMMLHNDG